MKTDDVPDDEKFTLNLEFLENNLDLLKSGQLTSTFRREVSSNNNYIIRDTREPVGAYIENPSFWMTKIIADHARGTRVNHNEWTHNYNLVARRKMSPRPLYAKWQREHFFREFDRPYGYDLQVGDWVRPHGRGLRSDLIFRYSGKVVKGEWHDVTVTLSFPNEGDGIIPVKKDGYGESLLLLGQTAPEEGYHPKFRVRSIFDRAVGHGTIESEPSQEQLQNYEGFWFRIHTKIDETTGEVLSARYGKLHGDFTMRYFNHHGQGREGIALEFRYFYSPDESRSLESDGTTLVPGGDMQGVMRR